MARQQPDFEPPKSEVAPTGPVGERMRPGAFCPTARTAQLFPGLSKWQSVEKEGSVRELLMPSTFFFAFLKFAQGIPVPPQTP